MSSESLRGQLGAIQPVNERERVSIEETLRRLDEPDPFREDLNPLHLTASAFVVSSRGVVLHRHRLLGIWVQPGGHVDPGETPGAASVRETLEETGLRARHRSPAEVFHVDVHPGPRGHTHFDLRYVLVAAPDDPAPAAGESSEVYWFDFAAAQERAEDELGPALEKLAHWYQQWAMKESSDE